MSAVILFRIYLVQRINKNPHNHNPRTQVQDMVPGPLSSHEKEVNQNSRDKSNYECRQDSYKRFNSMVAIGEMVDEGGKQVERNPDKLYEGHCPSCVAAGWLS
jgi:hypothetical protein